MSRDTGKALTVRAVVAGLVMTALFAALAPINDGLFHNTYLYSQHLPVGVFLLLVVLGVVVNPLLGKYRFQAKELTVVIGMLLVLGGVVGAGLNANLPPIIAGPAKILATSADLDVFLDSSGTNALPRNAYMGLPEKGAPDGNDPEYKYVIDGFHSGFGGLGRSDLPIDHRSLVTWKGSDEIVHTQTAWVGGSGGADVLDLDQGHGRLMMGLRAGAVVNGQTGPITILAVTSPGIPWGVWAKALLRWTPLLGSALICFICIAALVRHQWMQNERLTYPIAEVIANFLQNPEPGRRLAPVFRSKVFWSAFIVVALALGSQGLMKLGYLPVGFTTKISLFASFNFPPFNQGYADAWLILNPTIYFSVIGIVFFLPTDISLSVWLCFLVGNFIFAMLRMQGLPIDASMVQKMSMGGWFVECLFIIWVGRRYYMSLLKTAFATTDDPQLQEVRPFTWAFLASSIGMVLSMMAFGAYWHQALIAAIVYLGAGLVLARLVAEAGIPFIQMPMYCATVIFSLTGLSAPAAALVPLTLLGQTLCADGREHVLPFACNAEYLAKKAEIPRIGWGALALVALAVGTVVSGILILWCNYAYAGQQAIDGWWRPGWLMGSVGPIISHAEGGNPIDGTTTAVSYGVGAVVTGALGFARFIWSWWPISPIGMLVCACYPIYCIWFSFFLGWLCKMLVMRYGAVKLYNTLKPAAMGLIASEAVVAGIFLITHLIAGYFDIRLPRTLFLPG